MRCRESHPGPLGFVLLALASLVPTWSVAASRQERAVASFPESDGRVFSLLRKKCAGDDDCKVAIQLRQARSVLDELSLDWEVPSGQVGRIQASTISGVISALSSATGPEGWSFGVEESAVDVYPRPIRLSRSRSGLVLTEVGGFEHVKRRHDVLVAEHGHLKRVLAFEEGPGPAWSSVVVVRLKDGRDSLVYVATFEPGDDDADTLEASRYFWNDELDQLVRAEDSDVPLSVVHAGAFSSVAAGRKVKAASPDCFAAYVVVPMSLLGAPETRPHFTLAAVTASRSESLEARKALKACAPSLEATVSAGTSVPQPTGYRSARD